MQINSIKTFTPISSIQKLQNAKIGISLQPSLTCDIINFTGQDLLSLPDKEIFEKINESKRSIKNYLGEGGEANVYRIKDTDYCVRFDYFDIDYLKILDKNISEQDEVNHIVAKFGENSSIMHYISGSPVYTPDMKAPQAELLANEIAQMPLQTFKKLLHQICDAYDKDMMFDCNWGNVIANPKENKLTAIDFYKNVNEESLRPLTYTYISLIHPKTPETVQRQIAGKILEAGIEEFKPEVNPCFNPSEFDFSNLFRQLINSKIIERNNESKQCNLFAFNKILNELTDLKYIDIRKELDVSHQLNWNIKVLKTLIKQLVS